MRRVFGKLIIEENGILAVSTKKSQCYVHSLVLTKPVKFVSRAKLQLKFYPDPTIKVRIEPTTSRLRGNALKITFLRGKTSDWCIIELG